VEHVRFADVVEAATFAANEVGVRAPVQAKGPIKNVN